jgi:hypothetical protein
LNISESSRTANYGFFVEIVRNEITTAGSGYF